MTIVQPGPLVAAVAALMLPGANSPSLNPSNDRGIFVFSHFVLDFRLGLEVLGRGSRLANCSTATTYCADGELFNIVLPRRCEEIGPNSVWRQNGIETRVLNREGGWGATPARPLLHRPPVQTYYLHSNQHPEVVYQYSPQRGVAQIFYDIRQQLDRGSALDFVQMARDGQLSRFSREVVGDESRSHLVLRLLTLDQFAPCLPGPARASE